MYHECLPPSWIKVGRGRLDYGIMCRHTAPREQRGATLEGGEWLGNGYEQKRWPQDGVTKYSRSAGLKYQVQEHVNDV